MPEYSRNDIILIRYLFSDFSTSKVRPAIVIGVSRRSEDLIIVPLTSKIGHLTEGEFKLLDWEKAGLNVPSAVKRGLYTVHQTLIVRRVGRLPASDSARLDQALTAWLGL